MKTVLLINPGSVNRYLHQVEGLIDRFIVWFIRYRWDRRFTLPPHGRCTSVPPITLMAVQRLFEVRGWRVIVVDEQVEPIDYSLSPDLVGVTATTTQYPRAARIAARFRARAIPTLVGGIHATALPEECLADFDAVCIGEAETCIDEILRDFSNGRLKGLYRSDDEVEMDSVPFLRHDLKSGRHLPFHAVSFSRGCPHRCDFCSIRMTMGRYRTRTVEPVVDHIVRSEANEVWFADAALTADRRKARRLFRALAPLGIRWMSSISLDACLDEEMLDLMAESGCWLLSTGFETLSADNLRSAGKLHNRVGEYCRTIAMLHDRNIAVEGNFIFGFDGDGDDVFERTARFAIETGIDIPEFFVLTPYPGTPLFERLEAQGRIVDRDWAHYENVHFKHLPVFEPRLMSREQLRQGCLQADRIAYSPRNTVVRLRNSRRSDPLIILANLIYTRRLVHTDSLLPRTRPADKLR